MTSNKVIIQQTKSGQYFITVPVAIVDFKKWKKGTVLEITEDRYGEVTLKEAHEK